MLLHVPAILLPEELARARAILRDAPWQDGRFALDRAASRLLTTVH